MHRILIAASATVLAVGLTACAAGGTDSASTDTKDYPSQDLDWTIAFGPGGGNDIMSRQLVDIIESEDLYPGNITVENMDGGSGAKGWGHLYSQAGSGYDISTTSGSFLTTPLQADTGWTYEDFTPVGLTATDAAVFLVDSDSGIKTWDDWVKYAKDKGKVVVGGIGTVNVDYIVHAMLAEHEGYEIDYVPYNEEGQVQTSLLSGALDAAVSNPAEVLGQIESGDMTPLLYTGNEPMKALPDVPTAESIGVKNVPTMPRGVILPPDVPDSVRDWWIDAMKQVVKTDQWQKYLDQNNLSADVRWGDDFETYLDDTATELETKLEDLGAL
ncbi:Bug family tripartite tricarboxylate transporter substrate binding protein [Solicola gregarius]|uniref:Tripartite tricarboxylate transporter substrate binding protein n=1 Tax=Solicola gregarius TaxID=2908642 RepID=A0AA46TGC5_9ACTN|nr:tripartite tricarboxylate transporter substrate binding protein [Solicola gregarius]UYM04640.1 tripartite tricarboxylate transporter substrate binding protein [Solicola gregarius]